MKALLFWLKVSRPGLWFPVYWLYLLPLSTMPFWEKWEFWLGLAFCSFPLNFIIYAWNDIVDYETDQLNPRKDSFLFGAQGTRAQLAHLPKGIIGTALLTLPVFIYLEGFLMLALFAALAFVLWMYNHPKKGLRGIPPLELVCQFGYLLVVPFSMMVNDVGDIPWITYLYLLLFAIQSQLMGEVMDIEPDRKAGRATTATVLDVKGTKLLIIGIVLTEVLLLVFVYQDLVFAGMLGVGLLWLFLDLFLIFRSNQYSLFQMQLFGFGSNAVAFASMAYVWWSGCLLEVGL